MSTKTALSCSLLVISLALPFIGHASDPLAGLPDPTRHQQIQKKVVKKIVHQPLILQSTLIHEERRYAIINGKSLQIGERINGATLLTITPFEITLERHGQRQVLRLMTTGIVRKNEHSNHED